MFIRMLIVITFGSSKYLELIYTGYRGAEGNSTVGRDGNVSVLQRVHLSNLVTCLPVYIIFFFLLPKCYVWYFEIKNLLFVYLVPICWRRSRSVSIVSDYSLDDRG
jgi:hypothetical protein